VTSKLPKKTKTESSTSRTVDVRNQLHSTPTKTVRQSTHFRGIFSFSILMSIWVRVMVFNATLNNISVISWQSVLLVEEISVPGENH
jgi:hypothetical protein